MHADRPRQSASRAGIETPGRGSSSVRNERRMEGPTAGSRRPDRPRAGRRLMASHVIEPASTGRAKCRGCGERIAAGEMRFGESAPNPFGEGETTQWFHLECAAFKRPDPLLEALQARTEDLKD